VEVEAIWEPIDGGRTRKPAGVNLGKQKRTIAVKDSKE